MSNPNIQMGECATACIAHPLSPLAVLRIAAIARYYGSSRLARENGMHSTGRSTADSRLKRIIR